MILVPRWVAKALRGQPRALELYVLLAEYADDRSHGIPTGRPDNHAALADELGWSTPAVVAEMATLLAVDAVTVTGDGGYLLRFHPPAEAPA